MQDSKSIIKPLFSLLQPFSRPMIFAIVLGFLTISSGIALMMTSAWLISTAALQLGITSLSLAPTAVRLFGLSRASFRYLERLVSHDVTFRLLAHLRVWFYEHIEPLSPAQLGAYSSGDLMARLVTDIEELQNLYIRVIAPPIVAVFVTICVGITFSFIDVFVAFVAVIFMIIAGTVLPLLTWWIGNQIGVHVVEARANINIHLVDTIQGLSDSLAYGYASNRLTQLGFYNDSLLRLERHEAWLYGLEGGLSVLMVNLASFCVLLTAIDRVDGVLLATVTLGIISAFEPITPLALATQYLSKELSAAHRVFSLISLKPAIQDLTSSHSKPEYNADLSLNNIDFRYKESEPWVFHDFSIDIPYGSRVAITGESGSGKSSLVNLLLRFWEYDRGQVTVDGKDLRTLAHDELRQLFGVMTQKVHLFNTTIGENIRIADKSASDEMIVHVAKAVHIHDFIMSLPNGYDTYVGENGLSLSGGEGQRLALARILLKDAPIWILDEITANLDPITAKGVMDSVMQLGFNRTIILITHQTSMVEKYKFDQSVNLELDESNQKQGLERVLSLFDLQVNAT